MTTRAEQGGWINQELLGGEYAEIETVEALHLAEYQKWVLHAPEMPELEALTPDQVAEGLVRVQELTTERVKYHPVFIKMQSQHALLAPHLYNQERLENVRRLRTLRESQNPQSQD